MLGPSGTGKSMFLKTLIGQPKPDRGSIIIEGTDIASCSAGTAVAAGVISSGVVRSGDDRVEVLVFVNRPTTNKQQSEPIVYRDQVTVTMQRVGDSWLVDGLLTSPPGE